MCIASASPASPIPDSRGRNARNVQRRTSVDKNTRGIMRLGTRADISLRCTSTESEQDTERRDARFVFVARKKKITAMFRV